MGVTERDRERASNSQREPVRARGDQSDLETIRKSHGEPGRLACYKKEAYLTFLA